MSTSYDIDRPAFTRRVLFQPGYNDLYGPYGLKGMYIWFVLEGPAGAVHFAMDTGWVPPKPGQKKMRYPALDSPVHPPDPKVIEIFPMGVNVGWHWREPVDGEESEPERPCPYLHDHVPCHYTAGYVQAERVLAALVNGGDTAVWKALLGKYRVRAEEQRARMEVLS